MAGDGRRTEWNGRRVIATPFEDDSDNDTVPAKAIGVYGQFFNGFSIAPVR
jgi:hypothetical protein